MIDFGTSLVFEDQEQLDEQLGTAYYIAPEVIKKNYNYKCDIWSCGVITYILLSGQPPFNGNSDPEIMNKIKEGVFHFSDQIWKSISSNCKDFIRKLLTYNPDDRPTAE